MTAIIAYRKTLPLLRLDCGKTDLLIEYNCQFHIDLEAAGITHAWEYWQEHLVDTLLFFNALIIEK